MTVSPRSATTPARSTPRLYLVTPPLDAPTLTAQLAAALDAADVAAVLARAPAAGEALASERLRAIAPIVQDRGVALLIDGNPASVAPAGADGAHLTGTAALDAALPILKPAHIAGCGGLFGRDDAMRAGERGADYVMFGEPDLDGRRPTFGAILDRVAWWAELFEVPCVGWAASLDEVAELAAAGADFVAIGDPIWTHADGPGLAVAAAAARLKLPETAS
jgi:thiamine-phosphate pyrophosphorylase